MFNDKISVFEGFHSDPKSITLRQWLNICKHGSRYTKQIIEYRLTGDQELKKSLPLATVGAVCVGGRKMGNVVTRTGWIALDVDGKDNPYDAEQIRNEIANIENVAFSGLSTGGRGVWALVKVADPNKQAEHFEALRKDFERFGITLDSSKGRNPNDARFISYDPGAIIKDSFTVYAKLPPEPTPVYNSRKDFDSNYVAAAFNDELKILSTAPRGGRNNQLFKSSAALASFVAGGSLSELEVRQALEETARSIGLSQSEIKNTMNSGFDSGYKNPRSPETNLSTKTGQVHEQKKDKPLEAKFYPTEWDDIKAPVPGSREDVESARHTINDAEPDELKELMKKDPILKELYELFDCELSRETDFEYI